MGNSRQPFNVIKGIATTVTVQTVDGDGADYVDHFDGSEPLTAYAWPGDDQAQSFALTPTWNSGPLGLVDLLVPAANTTAQDPGVYQWLIKLTDNTTALAIGELNLLGAAGTGLPGLADLVSLTYIQSALEGMALTQEQVNFLPYAVNAASAAVRKWCNRNFTRGTYTEVLEPSLEGQVRLSEFPVNKVTRVSRGLDTALNVSASTSAFQIANVSFSTSGDTDQSGTALTYTGIVLTSIASGATVTTPLLFATYTTLTALATAINAVSGWSATVSGSYGAWPTSEIYCDDGSEGALTDTAGLRVFAEDVSRMRVDRQTGFVTVPRSSGSGYGPRWGPTWAAFDDSAWGGSCGNLIRVTYDAGDDHVRPDVQQATAQTVQGIMETLKESMLLKKESIGAYSYELNTLGDRDFIPPSAKRALSLYRVSNA